MALCVNHNSSSKHLQFLFAFKMPFIAAEYLHHTITYIFRFLLEKKKHAFHSCNISFIAISYRNKVIPSFWWSILPCWWWFKCSSSNFFCKLDESINLSQTWKLISSPSNVFSVDRQILNILFCRVADWERLISL